MQFFKYGSVLLVCALLGGCGAETENSAAPVAETPVVTDPGNPGDPAPAKIGYQQMQADISIYCVSCHANDPFVKSESGLRASAAKLRLTNKTMPPSFAPKGLPDNIRTEMLTFF